MLWNNQKKYSTLKKRVTNVYPVHKMAAPH